MSRMFAKHYHKDIKVRRLGLDRWPRQEFSYLPDAGQAKEPSGVGVLLKLMCHVLPIVSFFPCDGLCEARVLPLLM